MYNEKLSALMDGESFDSELFNVLSRDVKLQQSWQRYHLIRDVIRGDADEVLHLDIADRVSASIAEEPVRIAQIRRRVAPYSDRHRSLCLAGGHCWHAALQYAKGRRSGQDSSQPENPVFNTLPMMGHASPASLGGPVG